MFTLISRRSMALLVTPSTVPVLLPPIVKLLLQAVKIENDVDVLKETLMPLTVLVRTNK